ncbi:hypothetical protein P3T76_006459 [Phytophthora citrophthora]|uniref:Transmembrane protein n=1 Tax=Phytophthora citrophthora TaxID=4793 RepID=A0AAD9GP34_9STRA|nr:hypothetical protein P3T76_006459 [Phytophthora citrophthora]
MLKVNVISPAQTTPVSSRRSSSIRDRSFQLNGAQTKEYSRWWTVQRILLTVWLIQGVLPLALQFRSYVNFVKPHRIPQKLVVSPDLPKETQNLHEKCPVESLVLAGVWWNHDPTHYYSVGNTTVCHIVVPQYNTHGNYVIGNEKMPPFHTAPLNCANDSFLFDIYLYHASVGFYSFYEEEVGTYCAKNRMSYIAVEALGAYDINGVYLAEDTGSTEPRMSYWYSIAGAVWLIYRSLTIRRSFITCSRHGRRCDDMGEALQQHGAIVFVQENLRLSAHNATNFQRVALLYLIIEGIMTDLFLIIANDGWISKVQYVSLGYNLSGLMLILFEMLERTKWLKEKWRLRIKRLFFSYETALVGELVTAMVFQMVLSRLNASDFKRSKPTALAVSYYVWSLTCHGAVVLVILSIIASVRIPWTLLYVWWKHRSLAVFSAPCSVDTALGPRSRLILLGGYCFHDGKLFYKKSTLKAFGMMKVEEEDTCYLVLPKLYWISTPIDNLIVIGVISGHRVESVDERPCTSSATEISHKLGGVGSQLNFQPRSPKPSVARVVAWSGPGDSVISSPTEALFPTELTGDGV